MELMLLRSEKGSLCRDDAITAMADLQNQWQMDIIT